MKKLLLTAIMLLSLNSLFAQDTKYVASYFSSLENSMGFEFKGEFMERTYSNLYDGWYIAFQGEQYIKDKETYLNWGFAIGLLKELNNFQLSGGIRVAHLQYNKESKPQFGTELELNYNINESVFLGVRGAYDRYKDSPSIEEPTTVHLPRLFFKIGYKF